MDQRVNNSGMTAALAHRASRIKEPPTILMAVKARELRAAGHDVVNLTIGEPDFDTPDEIKQAANAALAAGQTKYSPIGGIPELRDAISAKLKRDNGLDYAPSEIVVSNGAKQAITNVCMAFLEPGDEAIVIAPFWAAYTGSIRFADATPVVVQTRAQNGFRLDLDALEAAITPKTKLILLNSPSNPSGAVYTRKELEGVIALAHKHPHLWILSDEIYEQILFDGKHTSPAALPGGFERTITVNGVSKSFAMTGWRIGYTAAPAPIAAAISKVQGMLTAGANPFAQQAAAFALKEMQGATKAMRDAYLERRDMIVTLLRAIPQVKISPPAGAFYAFPDISAYFGRGCGNRRIDSASDMADYLLDEALVSIVSGESFGDPNCIRISFAASQEEIRKGVERIGSALRKLT